MKKLIIILILFTINSYSQNWSIGVFQDMKLAIQEDDYGNSPFTVDVIVKSELFFNEGNIGKFMVYPQAEYADLAGGHYVRIAGGVGYTLGLYDSRINSSISGNWGWIERFGRNHNSWEFQYDISVRVVNHLRIVLMITETQRTDIGDLWRFNSYLGLKYTI